MPSNGRITVHVSVGNTQLPEYSKDGNYYVESSLFTPHSYEQEVRELVQGEVEVQSWPVTPYQVEVYVHPDQETSCIDLVIDDVKVDRRILNGGTTYVFKGFKCSEGTKEFLFSLPRFARDENDRVSDSRLSGIGIIKVLQYSTICLGPRLRQNSSSSEIQFDQANKKDAVRVTAGEYTMATTKQGRVIKENTAGHHSKSTMCTYYDIDRFISEVSIHYMMGYTLVEKGFKVKPITWDTSDQ